MKRLVMIIIALAVTGKLFALLITSIVHKPADNMKSNLFFDKFTQEQIHQNKFTQQEPQPQAKIIKSLPKFNNAPIKLNAPLKVAQAEKIQDKKTKLAQAKKVKKEDEKKRRKKRRKKLEDMATKKPEAPKFTVVNKHTTDYRVDQSNNGYGVGSAIANTIPTTKKPAVNTAAPQIFTPQIANANIKALTLKLINNPTYADMTTLIKLYQARRISAFEYYGVLNQMQGSVTIDSRRLAVMGASIEQNTESFQVLAKATIDEDTTTRETAFQTLKNYENLSSLSILSETLVSGVLVSKIIASNILGEVAKSFQASPSSDPEQRRLFAPFEEILNPLVADTTSPDLQSSAQKTLTTIRSILNS